VNITPVFNEKGACTQLIGSIHDITRQKQTEMEIKQLNEDLEKKVKERTAKLAETNDKLEVTIAQLNASVKEMESFSYSVSHDLRSPIRGINGFSTLLQKRYADKLDEDGKKMLEMVVSEAVRMGHLIDDLLAFSRLGRKEIQKTTVDMKALAQAALDEVMKLSDVKYNAKVTIHDLPPSFCDGMLLQQVFINLIANALKFSSHQPEPVIEVGSYSEDGSIVYYVKDNGAGFDMKYYDKLFGVFQRLHSMEDFPGTGIGLSIVHKIIERHGGRVWAEGKENGGATFYFSLPAESSSKILENITQVVV
jgi:light-regulated signal transduction histidine kinase (bacteriophytochrome)